MKPVYSLAYTPAAPQCFQWHLEYMVNLPPGVFSEVESFECDGETQYTGRVIVEAEKLTALVDAEAAIAAYLRAKGLTEESEVTENELGGWC